MAVFHTEHINTNTWVSLALFILCQRIVIHCTCTARLKSELCPSFHSHPHALMMCAVLLRHWSLHSLHLLLLAHPVERLPVLHPLQVRGQPAHFAQREYGLLWWDQRPHNTSTRGQVHRATRSGVPCASASRDGGTCIRGRVHHDRACLINVAAAPTVYAAPAPIVEYARGGIHRARDCRGRDTPVVEHIAPAPAVSNVATVLTMSATPASELEYVAPAPAVSYVVTALAMYTVPVPLVEYVLLLCHTRHQPLFEASVSQCDRTFSRGPDSTGHVGGKWLSFTWSSYVQHLRADLKLESQSCGGHVPEGPRPPRRAHQSMSKV